MASSSSGSDVQSLGVRSFVAARVAEIASLTRQVGSSGASSQGRLRGFSFQHVNNNMRRRAVSHNPKRLPLRLRSAHMHQLAKSSGGLVKQPKRPSKKYRKRGDGDILEYNRRQLGKPLWLESHIWHAKRFHMETIWGKRLARAPTAKCFRSLFRASKSGAVMQDISYLSCLEISGQKTELYCGMSALMSGDPFRFDPGKEVIGHVYFSLNSSYISPVRYLWITPHSEDTARHKLIIWLHPMSKSEIVQALLTQFQLELNEEAPFLDRSFPESPSQNEQMYLWRIIGNQVWHNPSSHVCLRDLSEGLNRVRITGLKTLSVLKEILKVGPFKTSPEEDEQVWKSIEDKQKELWQSLRKIVDIPSDTVLSLNVIDPRLELPKKREKVQSLCKKVREDSLLQTDLKPHSAGSPLWDQSIREEVLRTKTSDMEMAKIRSKNLIPGTSITHEITPNVIPVVLVFRSGISSRANNSSFIGADLILPMGWLMPFWIALSFRCVRAYGLEFSEYLSSEADPFLEDLPVSPIFPPDSSCYKEVRSKIEKRSREKFFLRPPAKRHNLIKLGCPFPFSIDWARFFKFIHGNTGGNGFQIIRGSRDLLAISQFLRKPSALSSAVNVNALVPVQLRLISGNAGEGSCICLPTLQDLEVLSPYVTTRKSSCTLPIQQKQLVDMNQGKREELTKAHHKRMSRLRKKRKIARRASTSVTFDLGSRLEALDSTNQSLEFNKRLSDLWLNDDVEDILSKQDRQVMGLTTYAHFSFLQGKTGAVGYVSVKLLKELVKLHDDHRNHLKNEVIPDKGKIRKDQQRTLFALVRNWSSSLEYHWATLTIPYM